MTTAASTAPTPGRTGAHLGHAYGFAVGLDGRPSGDDGRQGRLTAAVHYATRMAAQLDSALRLGPLRHLHATGTEVIDARVGWGIGGECLLEGVVRSCPATPLGSLTSIPTLAPAGSMAEAVLLAAQAGTRSATRTDAAVRRVHAASGALWTVLLDSDLTALRLLGDLAPGELAVLSSRTQGVVHGLGDPALSTLTLVYAGGTLVLTQLADCTLMFRVDDSELRSVAEIVARSREALAAVDEPEPAPEAVPELAAPIDPEPFEDDPGLSPDAWNDERVHVPAGARFAGMVREEREPRVPRAARWGRRRA